MVLPVMIGGEVGSYRPGVVSGMLVCRFRIPLLAKVSHSCPVSALIAEQAAIVRQHNAARTVGDDFRAGIIRTRFVVNAAAGDVLERRVGVQLRIESAISLYRWRVERTRRWCARTQIKNMLPTLIGVTSLVSSPGSFGIFTDRRYGIPEASLRFFTLSALICFSGSSADLPELRPYAGQSPSATCEIAAAGWILHSAYR